MRIKLCRWLAIGLAVVVIAVAGIPAEAKDDVMILRLEDKAPMTSQTAPRSAPPAEPAATADEKPTTVDVPPCAGDFPASPCLTAMSAVIMDADTGQVIYSKNAHLRRPNASTTKIMTAILLIENCGMKRMIRASKRACETPFTSLNLRPGEQISAKDLLMGMMIRSANDAAVVVAEGVGGSVRKFALMMNKKAKEIGCKDTHFVTPNGLPAKGHYSTAYDLCLIARYALRYPVFNEAVNTRKYFLESRTINRKDLAVFAKSKFLKNYQGADGIKSGYLKEAGHCYVGSATRDGWRLISAVLASENSSQDTTAVMNYAFGSFKPVLVARADTACAHAEVRGGSQRTVPVAPPRDLRVVVPNKGGTVTTSCEFKELKAPICPGMPVGTLIASVNGQEAAKIELRATEAVGISIARRLWGWTKMCGVAMICVVMGRRYGNAFTKGSRRRRRRVPEALRSFNRYG